ncbi:MAG TPA: hypothetical protein VNH82_09935 [Candidatus Dormibacteraeota bacterium]|nr:hypothetical protein [Candidatus Dormibacteraeota bacterium]HVC23728.1 hypothetical protein [Candidatus Dormibacteraeota bacterium]
MNQAQRTLRARLAALTLHATHDSREVTAPARRAFLAKFEAEVDPFGKLSPEVRTRVATQRMRSHMKLLAARSALARSGRAKTVTVEIPSESPSAVVAAVESVAGDAQ